jgi:low affinity Fe/Cu permease
MATGPDIPIHKRRDFFTKVSALTIRLTGGRWGFVTAAGVVIVWGLTGPFFGYSENWQLVINTGTSVVTFLMVFLIQNAQNRESKAIHLKLDELILAVQKARNELIDIENLTEDQLDVIARRYKQVAQCHEKELIKSLTPEPVGGAAPKSEAGVNGLAPVRSRLT